jgi:hypothetical protein
MFPDCLGQHFPWGRNKTLRDHFGVRFQFFEQAFNPTGQSAVRGIGSPQHLFAIIDLAAKMGTQQEKADDFWPENLQNLVDGEEIAIGFGHLLVAQKEQPIVEPKIDKGLSGAAAGLGSLVLVMGKQQVPTATMEVEVVT